ncbi:MAG: AMP-binding protein [Bacteroidales bacterium]|nr:AMP-binding protein [Bacteroidales bacterium]
MSTSNLLIKLNKLNIQLNIKNDKIDVTAPSGVLNNALKKEISENRDSLISYLNKQRQNKALSKTIKKAEKKEYYRITPAQQRLYLTQEQDLQSIAYNISKAINLPFNTDLKLVIKVFEKLISRHDSFKTSFDIIDGEIVQKINKNVKLEIIESFLQKEDVEKAKLEFIKPFDLNKAPLFRAKLITCNSNEKILFVDMHHIISDSFSLNIVKREFTRLFDNKELKQLPLGYIDYSEWLNCKEQKDRIKLQEKFWTNKFSKEWTTLNLSDNFETKKTVNYNGANVNFLLNKEETDSIRQISTECGTTIYMSLLAIYNIFLSKISGKRDIIIGSVTNGRTHAQLSSISGMFVNTIFFRNNLSPEITIKEFIEIIKNDTLETFANQEYPLDDLVTKVAIKRNESNNAISGIGFNFHNNDNQPDNLFTLKNIGSHVESVSKADLVLSVSEFDDYLVLNFEYYTQLFKKETIDRFIIFFKNIINQINSGIDIPISEIVIISNEEKQQLLFDFNNTNNDYSRKSTIHQLFEEQVEKNPDGEALLYKNEKLTYRELNVKSDRLASLISKKNIKNEIIAIILENPLQIGISLFAVLKSGNAFLPIDSDYPEERIKYMLKDANVNFLLSESDLIPSSLYQEKSLNEDIIITNNREQITDLDSLPFPDRSFINNNEYSKYIGLGMINNGINILATRGCPYKCTYCHKIWPKKNIIRSAENIFEEVLMYYNIGVRRFSFIDDIFNLNIKNSTRFFNLIIENGLKIQLFFPNGLRGDILTEDYIDLMVKAGLVGLALALETASPRLQKLIKKNLNIDKLYKNIKYFTSKYPQVILRLYTMHGFPSETEEEATKTLNFIKSIKTLHFPFIFILKIFPNTEMEKLALENGVRKIDIENSVKFAYNELPDTLPFDKVFTKKYQGDFLNNYFLSKDRLLAVLPHQLAAFTEKELIQVYSSYLPNKIKKFSDLLDIFNIEESELNGLQPLPDDTYLVPNLDELIKTKLFIHKDKDKDKDALRVLLLDLSQFFTSNSKNIDDVVDPPLGLVYLLTQINKEFGRKVNGKILKSRIDFDSYQEFRELLDEFKPDVIGIRTLTYFKEFFHKTISIIRNLGYNVPIITGGPYASSDYNTLLEDSNVDVVVYGEGEITFSELIGKIIENNKQLPNVDELEKINGLIFRKDIKKIRDQNVKPIYYDLFDFENDDILDFNKIGIDSEPTNTAYSIYTSGTSGFPKGTIVDHNSIVNTLLHRKNEYKMDEKSVSLQLFSFGFDGFITSFFTPMISGSKTIFIEKNKIIEPEYINSILKQHQVTHFISIPQLYNTIIENMSDGTNSSLQVVTLAGDMLNYGTIEKTKEKNIDIEIVNEYGVSESSVLSAMYRNQELNSVIKIGKPISNTSLFILDKSGNIQPIGVSGELCIGGVGLAKGYLNNVELTEEKFIKNPFGKGILYKTGDQAKWSSDGNIQLVGRIDQQVKIRGFRIETGEIENQMLKLPYIKEAVVVAKEDNQKQSYLSAYFTKYVTNDIEIWPSISEYYIYDELLYHAMTNDELRNKSYQIGIQKCVKDKIVVDVGTGRDAILARFCIEAGAKKVYAIELLEKSYKEAKRQIEKLGLQDKIIIIHGDATKVELPEKADVHLSEIVGSIGGSEGASIILNKTRHLIKENAQIIPQRSVTKIAAVTFPVNWNEDHLLTSQTKEYFNKVFNYLEYKSDIRLCVRNFPKERIISSVDVFEDLDYTKIIDVNQSHEIHLVIENDSNINGFLLWLNLHITNEEIINIIENEYCWLPVYVPVFQDGIRVSKNDYIRASIIRNINENELNSDYKIKGTLHRENDENINFNCDMSHFIKSHKSNEFYKGLYHELEGATEVKSTTEISAASLRKHLSSMLPDYMVPTYFVEMDNIPVTINGKVDKNSLPEPEVALDDFVAPRNEIEKKLAEAWSFVLGIDKIGINNNIFNLGCDSIKAIQLQAKMSEKGYLIRVNEIFENPTISCLATKVKLKTKEVSQDNVSGDIKPTPIQHFFFENQIDMHHFNQSVMLFSEERIDENILKEVFRKLQDHHDALRIVSKRNKGSFSLYNKGIEDFPISLNIYNLEGESEAKEKLTAYANQIQRSIDLENEPLMKLGLFHLDDGDRLLIVIHHLVTDGVSWRIIFEDIEMLYEQAKKGQALSLPLKNNSFKDWSEKLTKYAESDQILKQKEFWNEIVNQEVLPLKRDLNHENIKINERASMQFSLDEKTTTQLITQTNQAYGTEINDILLCGLGSSIRKTFGNEKVLVYLEGHGREDIFPDIDVSRTIGWFTSAYPVLLDVRQIDNLSLQLRQVKESLRQVPQKGIGYGILKYLTPEELKEDMQFDDKMGVEFNYLGQFDSDVAQMTKFRMADESSGDSVSLNRTTNSDFSVICILAGGKLSISLNYKKKYYTEEFVLSLLNNYQKSLEDIISHCINVPDKILTPSDLTYKGLPIHDLDHLSAKFDIEDIYRLAPLQEGILFHSLYETSPSYNIQSVIPLSGDLKIEVLRNSFNKIIERHDILRTVFVHENVDLPLQVVLKERKIEFNYQDLTEIYDKNEKELLIDKLMKNDKEKSFDLSKDVLMRVYVFKTAEQNYKLVWSFHHILMDGWCIGIIVKELTEIYGQLTLGRKISLEHPTQYKNYIKWINKLESNESEQFWSKYLDGFKQNSSLSHYKKTEPELIAYDEGNYKISLGNQNTTILKQISNNAQVTLNTLFHAVWGLLLSKLNDKLDVIFGIVVSGRSSEISGVESILGLFINTIPVRIQLELESSFIELIKKIQSKALESEIHHHFPLDKINKMKSSEEKLFDHILGFQNYQKLDISDTNLYNSANNEIKVDKIEISDPTNYDMDIRIFDEDEMVVSFKYNKNAYSQLFIEQIGNYLEKIFNQVIEDKNILLKDIKLSTEMIVSDSSFSDSNFSF